MQKNSKDGNEKVIISQEKVANNMVQVFKNPKNSSKFSHICETRSLNDDIYGIPKVSSIKIFAPKSLNCSSFIPRWEP